MSTPNRKENIIMAETSKRVVNYTDEMTAGIISAYRDGVDLGEIATSVGKTIRSVRMKLVREGVYIAKEKPPAKKSEEPTKKELLSKLDEVTPFEVNGFMGATKAAISDLVSYLSTTRQ